MIVKPHYALVVAGASSLGIMGALGFGRLAYPVILPVMQAGLGLSSAQSGLLATLSLAGYLLATAGGGMVANRLGARRTTVGGLGLCAGGLLVVGLAPALEVALAGQFLNGVGAGMATISAMGLTVVWFSPAYRGLANGVASSGAGPGMLAAGLLLPWLMGGANWRLGWFALAALVLGLAATCGLLLRNRPENLGLAPLGTAGDGATGRRGDKAAGRAGETARNVSPSPLPSGSASPRPLLLTPLFLHLGATFLLFGLGFTSYGTFFPAYLVREAGFSQAAAGGVWGAAGTLGIVGALVWGAASDWIGRRAALVGVYSLFTAAFLATALVPGPLGYYVAPLLFGLCAWAVPTIMAAAVGDYFPSRQVYPAMGLITAFSACGQGLGPSLAGLAADLSGSLTAAFFLAAAASLGGLALSLRLPRPTAAGPELAGPPGPEVLGPSGARAPRGAPAPPDRSGRLNPRHRSGPDAA